MVYVWLSCRAVGLAIFKGFFFVVLLSWDVAVVVDDFGLPLAGGPFGVRQHGSPSGVPESFGALSASVQGIVAIANPLSPIRVEWVGVKAIPPLQASDGC